MQNMEPIVTAAIIGMLGGLARALIGLNKALNEKRKITWKSFCLTLILATAIGGIIGWTIPDQHRLLIFFAGAGGTYLIENSYKAIKFAPIRLGK